MAATSSYFGAEPVAERSLKILFLISTLDIGGAERQLVLLASGLRQRGHDVTVATFYDRGPLRQDLAAHEVPVVSLDKAGRWDIAGFAWRLVGLVRRTRPDILHTYLTVPNLSAAALRLVLRPSALVWGLRYANLDLAAYDWLSRLTYRLQRPFARFADLVIANSRAGFDMATGQGYPGSRLTVIPNGIDTARFAPAHDGAPPSRARWAGEDGGPLVGIVARLDPMKDHDTFLRAAAEIGRTRKTLRFVCIGGGAKALRTRLQALADDLGIADRVVWADTVADMPAAYRALDLCVLSSAYGEGFPNVVAEAMACGVRCVVTDVGDAAEIVGPTGRVVPPRSPSEMAAAIAELLDPATTAAMPAPRARIVEMFSVDKLVTRTESALSALID